MVGVNRFNKPVPRMPIEQMYRGPIVGHFHDGNGQIETPNEDDAFDNDDKYARKVSIHFLGSQTANTMFRQIAFLVINLLQVFILIVDICLIIYTFELWMNILTCDLFFNSFIGWIAILVSLFHLFLNFALWYSFAHALIFLGVYGITTLVYVYLRFMINFAELRRTLTHFSSCHRDLTCILRENIRLFEIVFIGDRYFGKLFLLYLLLHLPISAYFLMEIFLGKVVGIARFAFIGLIMEAFVGSLGLHVATAHFSGYIHRGGKMLLNFNAKHNHGSKLMPLRRRLLIWRHINRLWVDKKFGISYAGLALVTMKTFSRFIFIYSELLMEKSFRVRNRFALNADKGLVGQFAHKCLGVKSQIGESLTVENLIHLIEKLENEVANKTQLANFNSPEQISRMLLQRFNLDSVDFSNLDQDTLSSSLANINTQVVGLMTHLPSAEYDFPDYLYSELELCTLLYALSHGFNRVLVTPESIEEIGVLKFHKEAIAPARLLTGVVGALLAEH
ncbi:hypothetical protein TYRP_016351 [Tyrophagus putrescentiae]|nr:hypothetical protein TYRP_016351 [Tyrophagus putrescentiae]